ncbi:MAG: 50S ribosomal protein L22 [Candidatus Sungbacteria bacterium]|nr:50S ribosomal protein L22 [Candidatus Sungbacteria bacterium]
MEAKASLHYLHIAPRKVRLVAGLLRGMDAMQAELELRNLPKRSSAPLLKLLKSAIQNAVHDVGQDPSLLYVKQIHVDGGPIMKRMMPRAFGRGATIRKRMSHVSLVLGVRGDAGIGKKMKTAKPIVREATKGDIKGEMDLARQKNRTDTATTSKKKFRGFSKKIFTRKVI